MGRGHWGVVIRREQDKNRGVQLVQNYFNPPKKEKENAHLPG